MYPTIKFTADWSKTSINFLDVTVSIAEGIMEADLYLKPIDSHQYLLWSSCHPFYCKKGIPYSQALRLNRICSNDFFDKRCNDLEKYVLAILRNALLERVHNQEKHNKIPFKVSCYLQFLKNTKYIRTVLNHV